MVEYFDILTQNMKSENYLKGKQSYWQYFEHHILNGTKTGNRTRMRSSFLFL